MNLKDQELKITIGITSYNAVNDIEKSIHSALEQSWSNTEIIIVDDASTDKTPLIIQKIIGLYPEIILIQNSTNHGVAVCRNLIIENATGEFIAFFDDDDVSLPNRLAKQYTRISEYESKIGVKLPVVCHTARLQEFPNGNRLYIPTMGDNVNKTAPHGERVAERILFGRPYRGAFGSCASCSQMGRTSMYREMHGYDESLRRSEDTEFNIRIAQQGGHFIGIKEPLVIQTMTFSSEKTLVYELSTTIKYMEKHKDFINERDSFDFCKEWIEFKYMYLYQSVKIIQFLKKVTRLFINYPTSTIKRLIWSMPNLINNLRFKNNNAAGYHSD